MKVLKFGGTSVGSAARIKHVAGLISNRDKNIVVLSAMSGTTNTLVEICEYLYKGNQTGAREIAYALQKKYDEVIDGLFDSCSSFRDKTREEVKAVFNDMKRCFKEGFSVKEEKEILSKGELISTCLMRNYLESKGVNVAYIPALEFMRIDSDGEADRLHIAEYLRKMLEDNADCDLYITEGYICRNQDGEVDNLRRGGSDLTASLVGAVTGAEEIEIWTDIDGMHNNDPRFVENTLPVEQLDFEEAAELAYFGAKILHPTCVLPAKVNNIPVRLLNTLEPEAKGTLIGNFPPSGSIKAIAAKDNITAIKIKSGRMLLAYGFMRKVFEIFETYRTPVDMVATSEVGVSVTIDSQTNLPYIVDELKKYGTVTVDEDMVIICVVGDMNWLNKGFEASALNALKDIPVRMISYGGSNYNISILVRKEDKTAALNALSKNLFNFENK